MADTPYPMESRLMHELPAAGLLLVHQLSGDMEQLLEERLEEVLRVPLSNLCYLIQQELPLL